MCKTAEVEYMFIKFLYSRNSGNILSPIGARLFQSLEPACGLWNPFPWRQEAEEVVWRVREVAYDADGSANGEKMSVREGSGPSMIMLAAFTMCWQCSFCRNAGLEPIRWLLMPTLVERSTWWRAGSFFSLIGSRFESFWPAIWHRECVWNVQTQKLALHYRIADGE